jgi:hypothetical protein
MARWQQTDLSTVPPSYVMAAGSTMALGIDFSNALGGGETVTAATSTLRDLDAGTLVSGLPVPTVASPIVTQLINAPVLGLARGGTYELVVVATISGTEKPGRVLVIEVVA